MFHANPRWWVNRSEVEARLANRWERGWLVGWRAMARNTDVRTVIASAIPRVAVGNSLPLVLSDRTDEVALLTANLSSLTLDYAARQKVGGANLNFHLFQQLPVLPPTRYLAAAPWNGLGSLADWIQARVLELVYTVWDMEPFARDHGWDGPPFVWDAERRALLRAELDAAFFHLYGLAEEDVDYVMETFPIVKSRDEEKHGHYLTKALILDVYRKMADAIATGVPYETILDPPPADPRAHSPREAGVVSS
jgi:hypothetical protein